MLRRKLELTRLPFNLANEQWAEDNGVTVQKVEELVQFWRTSYKWREEEARLNELPQYTCHVEVDNYGDLKMHFVHSRSFIADAIPLLFVHGWPGSFVEATKMMPILTEAGFHVVSPSLPGYGFSSCPDKAGFTNEQDAEAVHQVMLKLGYQRYVAQGGDWGSDIVRDLGRIFPEHVKAVHINHINLVSFSNNHTLSRQVAAQKLTAADHYAQTSVCKGTQLHRVREKIHSAAKTLRHPRICLLHGTELETKNLRHCHA